jgi:hypothetical protein
MSRPSRRLVLSILLGIAAAWLAAVAIMLVLARSSAERGLDLVKQVRSDPSIDHLLDPATGRQLHQAADDLGEAESWSSNPLLAPLQIVPVVGRQVDAAHHLNHAAHRSLDISADTLDKFRKLAAEPAPKGEGRVALVLQVNALVKSAETQLKRVDPGSGEALIGPLDDAHQTFEKERASALTGLHDADLFTVALGQFLQGPSHYLLVGANNAEMRAGSGMWLTASTIDANQGTLELGDVRPTDSLVLPKGSVPILDADLARNWSFLDPGHDFRQLALTPRFDLSAALAQAMWAKEPGGSIVDGVVLVDIDGLRALLRAVGPVTLDGVTYDAHNLRQKLLHDQYAQYGADQQGRKDALGEVARAAFDKLEAGGWKAQAVAGQLALAVQGRHLMVWSSKPEQQAGWDAASLDGRIRPTSLAVSLLNRGGNKLDPFLDEKIGVTTRSSGGRTQVTVQVDLTNTAPAGLPPYVAGGPQSGAGLQPGEYGGILVVNVPSGAGEVGVTGGEYTSLAGADGPSQARGVYLRVPSGGTTRVTVTFVLSGEHGSMVLEPSGRVPPAAWTFNEKPYRLELRRTVHW